MFRFFTRIGLVNLKLIKKLSKAQLSPWVGLFYLLAEEASGLRCMRVYWSASAPPYSKEQPWNGVRGLGDELNHHNLFFVHASGKIQALEELVIEGFFAKNWQAYLEERMSVRVKTRSIMLDKLDINDENLPGYIRGLIQEALLTVVKYQEGIENLIP